MSIFQFGLEIEYRPNRSELHRLLRAYFDPQRGPETWQLLDDTEKVSWIQGRLNQMGYGDRGEVLQADPDVPPVLPRSLKRDDTGNLELTFPPVDTEAQLFQQLDTAWEFAGPGSLQAVISLPRDDFFGPLETRDQRRQAWMGWFNFHHQIDVMERLYRNCLRADHPAPAQFLRHPFLGPMINLRHKLLKKTLKAHFQGEMWEADHLALVIRREHSFKYVGSIAYRPDLAFPERICLEIRDVHKDPELLKQKVRQVQKEIREQLEAFQRFSEIPSFDSQACFGQFSPAVQLFLQELFPATPPSAVLDFEKALFVHETYRNFAWPLDPAWAEWLKILNPQADPKFLAEAREEYVQSLEQMAILTHASRAAEEFRPTVGLLLMDFFQESGLLEAFRDEQRRISVDAAAVLHDDARLTPLL